MGCDAVDCGSLLPLCRTQPCCGDGVAGFESEELPSSQAHSRERRPPPAAGLPHATAAAGCAQSTASAALAELQRVHPDLRPDKLALIGVSGGRDSVALLHFLVSRGWKGLIVCHFNHGLRGRESGQDAAFVRRLAKRLKLRCEVFREDIAAFARAHKLSTEAAARVERDQFFKSIAQEKGAPFVFLAHHAEDNAETVLGNLCRGAGLQGLSGMTLSLKADGITKLRPLLEVRRAEIDCYIQAHGLAFREDSSNASRAHRRNRLRHEVLPLLAEVAQRDVVEPVLRTAKLAARDEAFLREEALRFAQQEGVWEVEGVLRLTPLFKKLHPALQSRIVRHWLVNVCKLPGIGFHEVEEVMGMLAEGGAAKVNLPGGHHVRRKAKRLFVERADRDRSPIRRG